MTIVSNTGERETLRVSFDDNRLLPMLYGEHDKHLAQIENQPRFESMKEYASLVGFNLEEALMVINSIPKIYENSNPSQ